MALSPLAARSSVRQQLTDEQKQQATELEAKLDAKLAELFGNSPNSESISFTLEDTLADTVDPIVLAEVIERYKTAGWRNIHIHASDPNLQLQFDW